MIWDRPASPITPSILNKKSDKYAPTLDSQGKITQQLLSSIDGKTTVENLAKQLLRDWPDNFTDKKEALRFIKNIIEKQD